MDNIIKALDVIIKNVTDGADADAIVAELEELRELIGEQSQSGGGEADAGTQIASGDPIRKAMGLKAKK